MQLTRRKFVKISAVAATGLVIRPDWLMAAGETPAAAKTLDVTANWCDRVGFESRLRVNEPDVAAGAPCTFRQTLQLPAGRHTVEMEYNPGHDRAAGFALEGKFEGFAGFRVNGTVQTLSFEGTATRKARCEITMAAAGEVALELTLMSTRPLTTRLVAGGELQPSTRYRAVAPTGGFETVLIRGIPFMMAGMDRQQIGAWLNLAPRKGLMKWEQDGWTLDCGEVRAGRIHFAGMISSVDLANGSWYSKKGDPGYSHFVGDRAGSIVIGWSDGGEDEVPLVYGLNFWYGQPWDMLWHYAPYGPGSANPGAYNLDADLFGGDRKTRHTIRDAVCLTDGERSFGGLSNAARYIFSLDTQGRRIRSLRITGDKSLHGFPLIGGITVETEDAGVLRPLPAVIGAEPVVKAVDLVFIKGEKWRKDIAGLQRILHATTDDLPALKAPVVPHGYFGPRYDFQGPREAVYAATFLFHNAPECAAHIADSGTQCASKTARKALTHYTSGMGVWRKVDSMYEGLPGFLKTYKEREPGKLPGYGSVWSRGAGSLMREATAFGYDKFINSYSDWLDRCLLSDATPPHWIRIPGTGKHGEGYATRQVGDAEETGNRENDGHGICMWGRYMVWHWQGRSKEWNERHWAATTAAVEWIQWQLDTDAVFPGKRKDVLYTESECAHNDYDIYSSFNCLHGLKLSIRMAEQLGKTAEIGRWTRLHERLRRGILDHLVDQTPEGPIWHTAEKCDWLDYAHKLVHIHLATEGDTFTPLEDYAAADDQERRYLEISRNSYRFLMRDRNYNCLRMYGYGQGMMTQAALLLDEMADVEQFLNRLVSYCYLPNLEGWTCPEGIIVHRDGKLYLPVNGYMGQDSHVADATKALRVMLGVDDNNPEHLRLVPRFPASWSTAGVRDFPMRLGGRRGFLTYTQIRTKTGIRLELDCGLDVAKLSLRLGPLPGQAQIRQVSVDGKAMPFREVHSGDSRWAWLDGLKGRNARVDVAWC